MSVPCSPTPAGPLRSATAALWYRLPPNGQRRLPRQILISGLNHTAPTLAVYASQGGLLHRHARLASGWLASLSGRADYPLGPSERFQVISSPFPRLLLAHPFHSIEIIFQSTSRYSRTWRAGNRVRQRDRFSVLWQAPLREDKSRSGRSPRKRN